MIDDFTIRQAADTVYDLLRQFLQEPTDEKRSTLISTVKHYSLAGLSFKLTREGVTVTRTDTQRHLSGYRDNAHAGGVNA